VKTYIITAAVSVLAGAVARPYVNALAAKIKAKIGAYLVKVFQ